MPFIFPKTNTNTRDYSDAAYTVVTSLAELSWTPEIEKAEHILLHADEFMINELLGPVCYCHDDEDCYCLRDDVDWKRLACMQMLTVMLPPGQKVTEKLVFVFRMHSVS